MHKTRSENMSNNKGIISNENIQGWLKLTVQENSGELKTITIPAQVNGKDILLLDPYDKTTGKGCMVPNDIFSSNLSNHAKLVYCVLRSHIYHNFGFTFINREKIEQGASLGKMTVINALKELRHFDVIDYEMKQYQGINKNYYMFIPVGQWQLPTKEQYKEYRKSIGKETTRGIQCGTVHNTGSGLTKEETAVEAKEMLTVHLTDDGSKPTKDSSDAEWAAYFASLRVENDDDSDEDDGFFS